METKRYKHVTRDIRCQIYALNTRGFSKRAIAKQLGFSPSTICREFKRNTGKRGYRYHQSNRQHNPVNRLTSPVNAEMLDC